MNIGFDASRTFITERTGTENYSYQILTCLSKIDRNNQYSIFLRPEVQLNTSFYPPNFKFITLNYKFLWTQLGLSLQTFRQPKLDILFVPAHTLPLIHRPDLKTVVTVHDLGAEYLPKMHQLKQRLYLQMITRYQLRSASHLIAVSQATKKDLIKKGGISAEKISVIHESYDKTLFKPVNNEIVSHILNKFDLKQQGYFVFVGTIQPRKNLERLIKAYTEFTKKLGTDRHLTPTPKLVIIGSKGWLSEEIYQLPQKLGVEKQVRFLGHLPDKELPALYSGAIALLYPSLFEGFGIPLLEAMACNCPVLTSDVSSMPEVVGQAAVLVNPYSTPEIVRGIQQISAESTRVKLIKAGQEQIKKFDWKSSAQATLEVFQKIA